MLYYIPIDAKFDVISKMNNFTLLSGVVLEIFLKTHLIVFLVSFMKSQLYRHQRV